MSSITRSRAEVIKSVSDRYEHVVSVTTSEKRFVNFFKMQVSGIPVLRRLDPKVYLPRKVSFVGRQGRRKIKAKEVETVTCIASENIKHSQIQDRLK